MLFNKFLCLNIKPFDVLIMVVTPLCQVYDSELNCLGTVRGGDKVVVGSGDGKLFLFSK